MPHLLTAPPFSLTPSAKTPKAVIDRLNREMNSVLADKAILKRN